MRPDRKELLKRGGMNVTLDNALTEGGPRNGVLTAVEDFIASTGVDVAFYQLPFFNGLDVLPLGILVEGIGKQLPIVALV